MALQKIKALHSGNTIVMHYEGQTLNIQKSSRPDDFKRVEKLIEAGNVDELITAFIDIKAAVEKYSKDKVTVESGMLIDRDTKEAIPAPIAKKLLAMKKAGEDFMPIWRFWEKLKLNPSKNSVAQLYTFIEKNNVPITELGDLLLEKGVKQLADGSLVDDYTSKLDNSIGMIVTMKRENVVDDPQQTCSAGLHVAPPDYVREWYGQKVVVIVSVNPQDVVSVPIDYNNRKMRVCRYQVIGLSKKAHVDKLVVKLEDLVQLPAVEDRAENQYTDEPLTLEKDLMKLTAKGIISHVRKLTGKRITMNLKNKQGIAKKAAEILTKAGKNGFATDKAKKGQQSVDISGRNCKEVIASVRLILGDHDTDKAAGTDPRRGRFIAKVIPELKKIGYTVVDKAAKE